jgi:hypothetical protein
VTTVTVEVDPAQRTLAVQGHWWYRGVHTITPHPRGSRLDYRVHNMASWGRWMVPLMQWRLPTRMRRDLDELLRMIAEQLGCAAYPLSGLPNVPHVTRGGHDRLGGDRSRGRADSSGAWLSVDGGAMHD